VSGFVRIFDGKGHQIQRIESYWSREEQEFVYVIVHMRNCHECREQAI
jgi:hypothetical protein